MVDMLKEEDFEYIEMKKALQDIYNSADEAMSEPAMGAKALMSFRWIKKLAERGLGKLDD
jgi:hypothetical protein